MKKVSTGLIALILMVCSVVVMAADGREAIHESAELVQPLLVGMQAPDFTVRDVENKLFEFDAQSQTRPVVLTFFRGGWCPYCNLHLSEMRFAEEQLKNMGFNIWFISIDKPDLLLESLDDPGIGYTVYSDASLHATRAFGLAFRVDDELNQRYLGYGIDLESASGETHHVLPAPATYIIGTDGIINFAYINPDYKVRLHPDVLLAAAKAYKENADSRLVRSYKKTSKK
ncbi:MAG: AhpC/TSA family protein [Xanthomonadales bacterium]|nr:AhpC/TSA family protein [Gammaproteobacteria bacterium]NNK03000.1 AhpC/TSA family protein [Xanthomonadales bacterium]